MSVGAWGDKAGKGADAVLTFQSLISASFCSNCFFRTASTSEALDSASFTASAASFDVDSASELYHLAAGGCAALAAIEGIW